MNSDLFLEKYTIADLHQGYRDKTFSVYQVTQHFLEHAKKRDENIHAFLEFFEQSALKQARLLDEKRDEYLKEKALPQLFGVPIAIKDNMLYMNHHVCAASKILETYVASYTATAVKKLIDAGAVIIGRTNCDEFAMGASTEYSAFGVTKNPYDTNKVPGGSSGGSAASVAADMTIASLGSDTGGSIRQPASFCGVVGLKPTYGAVSRYGLIALASSLDQIGPFAKTVSDVAAVFDVIAGHDPLDATSDPKTRQRNIVDDGVLLKKKVLGVPKEYFISGMDPSVEEAVKKAIARFEHDGFTIREVSLPHTRYGVACYYIILPAEASSNLARFDGVRYSALGDISKDASLLSLYQEQKGKGFGEEVRRRILLGTFVLSSGYYDAYYAQAQKVRRLILDDFQKVFASGVDALLAPVSPTTAFSLGEKKDDPLAMYLSDIFTIPVNLAGLCSLSLPVDGGYTKENLPVGFQIIGNHFNEQTILSLGHYYEAYLKTK